MPSVSSKYIWNLAYFLPPLAINTLIQAMDISLLNYSNELLTCLFQTSLNASGRMIPVNQSSGQNL